MEPDSRARIEALCSQLGHGGGVIRAIEQGRGTEELTALLALLTGASEPEDGALTDLLDKVDAAAARSGLQGLTTVVRGGVPELPGGMIGSPEVLGWSCPLRRCSRVILADESDTTPKCAAAGGTGMLPYKVREP